MIGLGRLIPAAVAVLLGAAGCGESHDDHATHGHAMHGGGPGGVLAVTSEPADIEPGRPVVLSLTIAAGGARVVDFDTVHEKKLHLIIVRDRLDHFAHIHPELDRKGTFTVRFTFPTAGTYRLYADHTPKGKAQAVAIAELTVAGEAPAGAQLEPDVPGRVTTDALRATVTVDNPKANATTRLSFELADPAGNPVTDLRPYLGAMGHVVILSEDGKTYVHAHPVEGARRAASVVFDAHFPRPGLYKGWAEFRRPDAVHAVPFVLRVE